MSSPMTMISTLMAMCSLVAVFRLHQRLRHGMRSTPAQPVVTNITDDLAYYHWMS